MRHVLMFCFAALLTVGVAFAETNRPNILFCLADDLGWSDLGCYGSSFYETPHLDRLAATGARLTDAYAACPVCSPTRVSIMSGKYPARLDTTDWFGAPQPGSDNRPWARDKPLLPAPYIDHLPLEEVTLAETLKSAGYATFFAGKWHLGGGGFSPEDQGFDVNKGGYFRGAPTPPTGYFSPYGNPKLSDGPEGEHLPARLAEETVSFIRDQQGEPFFAMLSFYSVHTPLQTRADLEEKYKRKALALDQNSARFGREGNRKVRLVQDHAVYAGMVEAMDLAVGTVLDALEDLNLATNTIVFFTSDNGGLSTSEGGPTSNYPLRAGKGWLYEGGIRESTLVRWPGKIREGLVIDAPVMSTDFYPTILDMTGTTLLPSQHIDGVSIAPLLRGDGALPERALYWHYPHYHNQGNSPAAAIREGPYKLLSFYEDDRVELYNLSEDIGEQVNLAEKLPDKAKALLAKLRDWQEALDAKVPSINPRAASN